jgi:hypothetical protein
MSAFVVERETIDRVMWGLKYISEVGFTGTNYEISDLDRIGENLWNLNLRAVAYRYRLTPTDPAVVTYKHYRYGGSLLFREQPIAHKVACLKAMECLVYQCSEGEQFEADPYFKLLEKTVQRLACAIVHDMPEYEKAKWG